MNQPPNPFQLPENRSGHKIGLAVACLQISGVLYFILGLLMCTLLGADTDPQYGRVSPYRGVGIALFTLLLFIALIVGIQIVVAGLRRRRFWAWVTALCIFGVYLPSLFFPLGALGLWGLLDSASRAEFGLGARDHPFPSQFDQTRTDRHQRSPRENSSDNLSDPDSRIPPARPI